MCDCNAGSKMSEKKKHKHHKKKCCGGGSSYFPITPSNTNSGCASSLATDPICTNRPQPYSPPDPELSLEGENVLACYNKKPFNTNVSNLNQNYDVMDNTTLRNFLSTPVVVPAISIPTAQYVVDPPIAPAPCNDAVFPPVPTTPLPPNGRRVLIVGGAKNIGKTTAEYLSANGFTVIASSSRPDAYEPLVGANYVLSNVPLDVRCESSVSNFFSKVINGPLDAVVFLAGAHSRAMLNTYTGDDLRNALEIKVFGAQRVIYYAQNYLRQGTSPRFLMAASVAGGQKFFTGGSSTYDFSNHSLTGLTIASMVDERSLYGAGQITNPISYTVLYPILVKSTIGLYEMLKPKLNTLSDVWSNAYQSTIGAAQAGLLPGFPADTQLTSAQQIYLILTSPQPSVNYYLGDPNIPLVTPGGPTTWGALVDSIQTLPVDVVINNVSIPFTSLLLSTATVNFSKSASLGLYFPP